jgi:Na+/H+ antiporter NhaD/arsenite permease-like protein
MILIATLWQEVLTERLLGVGDELGATLAELGSGDSIPAGPYMNVWSGIGSALENNHAVATIVGNLVQQVKLNATSELTMLTWNLLT